MKKVFLIRKSDFERWQKADLKTKEWDTMEFRPVTREWLQKQANWFTLKGTKHIATQYRHWPYPHEWINRTNIRLYQHNYKEWLYRYDEDGVMRVRAGLGHAESIMGLGIVEKIEVILDDSMLPEPLVEFEDKVMSDD